MLRAVFAAESKKGDKALAKAAALAEAQFKLAKAEADLVKADAKKLKAAQDAVAAAQKIGGDIHVLVAGADCSAAAQQAASLDGVSLVKVADAAHYQAQTAENLTALVVAQAAGGLGLVGGLQDQLLEGLNESGVRGVHGVLRA